MDQMVPHSQNKTLCKQYTREIYNMYGDKWTSVQHEEVWNMLGKQTTCTARWYEVYQNWSKLCTVTIHWAKYELYSKYVYLIVKHKRAYSKACWLVLLINWPYLEAALMNVRRTNMNRFTEHLAMTCTYPRYTYEGSIVAFWRQGNHAYKYVPYITPFLALLRDSWSFLSYTTIVAKNTVTCHIKSLKNVDHYKPLYCTYK